MLSGFDLIKEAQRKRQWLDLFGGGTYLSSFAGGSGMMGMAQVSARPLRPTKPRWHEGTSESWAFDQDMLGRYKITLKGRLWWKRFVVNYEWSVKTVNKYGYSTNIERRKLAEFKAQTEAKNYVETVWRMQAGGAFNPKGVE